MTVKVVGARTDTPTTSHAYGSFITYFFYFFTYLIRYFFYYLLTLPTYSTPRISIYFFVCLFSHSETSNSSWEGSPTRIGTTLLLSPRASTLGGVLESGGHNPRSSPVPLPPLLLLRHRSGREHRLLYRRGRLRRLRRFEVSGGSRRCCSAAILSSILISITGDRKRKRTSWTEHFPSVVAVAVVSLLTVSTVSSQTAAATASAPEVAVNILGSSSGSLLKRQRQPRQNLHRWMAHTTRRKSSSFGVWGLLRELRELARPPLPGS